ncbi:pre-mRNA-processing factor 39 isoform X1 [Centruroides vittatus]|uniref:pre-mRNA-processing factor 39 isoform X1 n=1 Tax=Centruroides vittatus TaxID=120091 RepID=UPI00350EB847
MEQNEHTNAMYADYYKAWMDYYKKQTAVEEEPEIMQTDVGQDSSTTETSTTNVEMKENDSNKEMAELEKYWQTVKENPSDFTGWTYLLQYVEQENNLLAAREAFDEFFKHYPYCYGYWKKYADMEKKMSTPDKAEEVFERGLQAIPLSVDLWIHYINFCKTQYADNENNYKKIKDVFERAVEAAGREFRSDRLWDLYVNWEQENGNLKEITGIYDKLFTIPTQLYSHHFEKFQEHIKSNIPKDVLSTDEFLELRQEFVTSTKKMEPPIDEEEGVEDAPPPGVDDEAPPGLIAFDKTDKDATNDDETKYLKEKILERRRAIFVINEEEVSKRWAFEEGIKRPYFHVKPLERAQLKNWRDYLDFEMQESPYENVVVLFERCMIACALYEDMWMKYIKYAESFSSEAVHDIYRRACTIHLPRKPNINLAWATYEERQGNYDKASEVLLNLEYNIPELLEATLRRINLERRRQNHQRVEELYQACMANAKTIHMGSHFAIKYSRYLYKVRGEFDRAVQVLKEAIQRDPTNPNLYMQLVDAGYQSSPMNEQQITEAFDEALASEMDSDQKMLFSQRKLEFLEDFGNDTMQIKEAFEEYSKMMRNHIPGTKKRLPDSSDDIYQDKKSKLDINGTVNSTVATTVQIPSTQDTTAYAYPQSWQSYAQTAYNYQQPWSAYPASYYPTH